jgi:hypothetical protein
MATLLAATACDDDATDPSVEEGDFVGTVNGSEAFVSVVTNGDSVLAHVCDGLGIAEWFAGEATGRSVQLVSENGASLDVDLTDASASGTFTPPQGAGLPFTAEGADDPAGLYRSEGTVDGEELVGGWIALEDGRIRGAVCNAFGQCPPGAPPPCITGNPNCNPCVQQFGQLCNPRRGGPNSFNACVPRFN